MLGGPLAAAFTPRAVSLAALAALRLIWLPELTPGLAEQLEGFRTTASPPLAFGKRTLPAVTPAIRGWRFETIDNRARSMRVVVPSE